MGSFDVLGQYEISLADVDQLVAEFTKRAQRDISTRLPESVYRSAAMDLIMGAIEFHEETQESMEVNHSVKTWIAILTDIDLS